MKGFSIQMIIQYVNRQSKEPVQDFEALIRLVLSKAMDLLSSQESEEPMLAFSDVAAEPLVYITFVSPAVIRRINKDTRGVDRLTDVLSFPLLDMKDGRFKAPPGPQDFERTMDGQIRLPLGDIILAPKVARQQAIEYGHSLEREMAFLALHGFLHLIGFDHDQPEREAVMTAFQESVLSEAGLSRPPVD